MSEKQRYRMTFKCSCGEVFKKLTTNPDLLSPACPTCKKADKKTKFHRLGDGPIPSTEKHASTPKARPAPNTIYKCKDCAAISKVFEEVGETAMSSCPACDSPNIQYRGHISHDIPSENVMKNKAIDVTADIVMQDYKMGDLKDNVRMGETMAPKLEPRLQSSADNMFNKKNNRNSGINAAALAKRAMAGSMRDSRIDPVRAIQPSYKPKVSVVAGDGVGVKV